MFSFAISRKYLNKLLEETWPFIIHLSCIRRHLRVFISFNPPSKHIIGLCEAKKYSPTQNPIFTLANHVYPSWHMLPLVVQSLVSKNLALFRYQNKGWFHLSVTRTTKCIPHSGNFTAWENNLHPEFACTRRNLVSIARSSSSTARWLTISILQWSLVSPRNPK